MICLVDNGQPGPDHRRHHVALADVREAEALRKFDAALAVDPLRQEAGIVLLLPKLREEEAPAVAPAALFEAEEDEAWRIHIFDPPSMQDAQLEALLDFAASWPAQRNIRPEDLTDLRREAARRGLAGRRGAGAAAARVVAPGATYGLEPAPGAPLPDAPRSPEP